MICWPAKTVSLRGAYPNPDESVPPFLLLVINLLLNEPGEIPLVTMLQLLVAPVVFGHEAAAVLGAALAWPAGWRLSPARGMQAHGMAEADLFIRGNGPHGNQDD